MRSPEGSLYRHDIDGLRAVAIHRWLAIHAFRIWQPGALSALISFLSSQASISGIIFTSLEKHSFIYLQSYKTLKISLSLPLSLSSLSLYALLSLSLFLFLR